MKTWIVHTSVDVEIIGLQKTLKLVSVCLETQADTTLHVRECWSQHGANYLDNVGASTPHNPIGLHGMSQR
jgi:hypothetical protein